MILPADSVAGFFCTFLMCIPYTTLDGHVHPVYKDTSERSKQMARQVTHLSKVRQIAPDTFRTGTICNRFLGQGDINCTSDELEVTCKFCASMIVAKETKFIREMAA